jgi:glyoxylase-like metal-dependent hydrolase (beta-lactamase superfamily II)
VTVERGGRDRVAIDCDPAAPRFTAAYLVVEGDECAFIETHTAHARPKLLAALDQAGRGPADVRFVVVTHAHLDHAAGAAHLLAACPNATLLAHPRAARHLVDPSKLVASATAVYGDARFAELYGAIDPVPASRARALEDGERFEVGASTFTVRHTAGHAKHHFVVEDPATGSIFTGDAFGLVYPALQGHGRFAIASTSPTDFDATEARRSLDVVVGSGAESALLTHFGAIRDLGEVADQLRAWIDRSEAWVVDEVGRDGSPKERAARLAHRIREAIRAESDRRGLGFGEAEHRLLDLDVELNAQGLAFVADKRRRSSA